MYFIYGEAELAYLRWKGQGWLRSSTGRAGGAHGGP